jgi:hypothetical protein
MSTPPELVPIFPPDNRPQPLDIFPSATSAIELTAPLTGQPDEVALTTLTPQLQEISLQRQQQEENKLLGILKWLGEASGIPSIARSVLSVAPDQIEEPIRQGIRDATGIDLRRATPGDYVVSGITLLGGFGVRGALKLMGASLGSAVEPVVAAGSKGIREGIRRLAAVEEAVKAGKHVPGAFAEPITARLSLGDLQTAAARAIEMIRAGDDVLEDKLVRGHFDRLFRNLADAYGAGAVDVDVIPRIMADMGVANTSEGRVVFAKMLQHGWSEWGRTGKVMSDLRKELGKVLSADELAAAGLDDVQAAGTVFRVMRGAINFWRGSITSQLATAVRNLEVGLVRMPLKFFEDVASGSVQAFAGATGRRGAFVGATENLTAMWRGMTPRTRRGIERLLRQVDESEDKLASTGLFGRLFQTPVHDMLDTGVTGGAKRVLNFLQLANRTQENFMRSIAFDAMLSKRLLQMGIKKEELFGLGPERWIISQALKISDPLLTRELPEAQARALWQRAMKQAREMYKPVRRALTESVNEALEVTFALRPSQKMWNHLFAVYGEFPAAALIHPFPRFFANSIKFLKEHSPFGLARFMTEGQRSAISRAIAAKGMGAGGIQREATEALGKAMSGYMLHAGALALRNSDMAGERWYEIRVGDKIVDARPFNPLAAYLLLAEQMRKLADPDAAGPPLKVRDFAEAFAGIRRFTGTGLFIFNLFDSDVESFTKGVTRTASELVGGFTIPFRTFKDFLATAKEDEAVFRAKDGIFGPLINNLPLAGATRAPEPRAAREGYVGEEPPIMGIAAPTFRQLTGVIARTRTPVEAELINRDVSARPGTGDPELDRSIMEAAGPEIDERISRVIQSSRYRRASDVDKRAILSREVSRIRSRAKERIFRTDRREIVDRVVDELRGYDRKRQQRELRRMRNSGRVDARLERLILRRLQRTG